MRKENLETKRLILRPWEESDAEDLYKYASNPDVGPIAGWPSHQSIAESSDIIKNVLSGKECYAICLKEDGKAIGAIELLLNGHTDMTERDDECELGYWLGKPFWGQGIMPEAVKEIIRHGFEDAGMTKIWCGYYEGNSKSKRVQEKVGFIYQWKSEDVDVPLMNETRIGHVSCMTKEDWLDLQKKRLSDSVLEYKKATIEDIDELVRTRIMVLRAANKLSDDEDMSVVETQSRGYYERALESGEHIAYLVYDNDEFVGAGGVSFYQVMPTYHNSTGKKAYIMNMYTAPKYRRQGIAFHTLDLLVKEAREQGISQIALEATDMGLPLYEKYGFKKLKNEMEI